MIDPYVAAERPDKAWSHLFFSAFLASMAEGLSPGRTADFREKFASFLDEAQRDYQNKKVGARSLAPVILLMQYGLFVMDVDIESRLQRHVLIVICNAIQSEILKDDDHLTDRACTNALQDTLYRPLMPAWKRLIEFCFFSYREPLKTLISASLSLAAWEGAIRDIFPFLWLPKIAPIHEVEFADHVMVDNPEMYGKMPATYTNTIRRPLAFYALFSAEELQAHADEQKIIDETFAHLNATLGLIALYGDNYLGNIRAEVFKIAEDEGRIVAHQKVLLLQSHSLSIPKFFADSLINELTSQSSTDR
jgi:hypothetical protein